MCVRAMACLCRLASGLISKVIETVACRRMDAASDVVWSDIEFTDDLDTPIPLDYDTDYEPIDHYEPSRSPSSTSETFMPWRRNVQSSPSFNFSDED